MISPNGEGDPGHMWGMTSIAFPTLRNLTKNLTVPGWERLLFLHGGMGPSHIVQCARLYAGQLGIEGTWLKKP